MKSKILYSIPGMLLLCYFGCSTKETVTVSGAVSLPGGVAYRPGLKVRDYLTAAGGYLAEADTGRVALVRSMPDSLTTGIRESSGRWMLKDAPALMPGDLISVPLKAYRVTFDTVLVVENLRLEWNEHIYCLERGVAVPAMTTRGVVAAVVIGKGEVVREATGKMVGPFQYLYLTMHPENYEALVPSLKEPVTDRDAQEDAEALHGSFFQKSAFWYGKLAQLPPQGHFRVQAGIWLKPKNESFPGKGVRKHHYGDGRVWTTFPDGRQRWRYPDGRVVMRFRDKTREVRFPDGSVRFVNTQGGVKTTFPDGRMVFNDADGNQHRMYRDGRKEWKRASGNRITIYPDGRRVHRFVSGTVRTVHPNGVERTSFTDGTRHVLFPGGKLEIAVPSGVRETRYPDGSVLAITGAGHRIRVFRDGRQFTRMNDGTTIEQFPDGRKIQRNPTGVTLEVSPDHSQRTVYPDGSETVRSLDGLRVARVADGTMIEQFPDGRIVQTDTSGVRIEFLTPDRHFDTDQRGDRVLGRDDSTSVKQLVEPYRYRGPIRRDLIRLERFPERISPGRASYVQGSVEEAVKKMSMAVFAIPDGDVQDMEIYHDTGYFDGRLQVGEPGFYRLQIQCELEDGDVVMLEDRMLKVGDPKQLETPVFEVAPFPGNAAAGRRLMDMVNELRVMRGRMRLEWADDLASAAASHVEHMLAYGSVSHWSSTTGDLESRLERLDIAFVVALENLATAPSLEEAHWQLTLSAEHRRNILDDRLTHIGVAAARELGQVWVVEIFKSDK